jgi:hypothetical protein
VGVGGVDLQMLGRHEVGIGDHGVFAFAQDDLAVIFPGGTRDGGGGEVDKLANDGGEGRLGEGAIGGDEADPGVHVVLGLREKVGGDRLRVAGFVGEDEDLARARELVDAHGAEDLPFRLVHVGVPGADDFVDGGHGLRAVGHGGDRLRAADAEDAVGSREVTAGAHGRVRRRRQAGDHLLAAGDLRRHDGHDRRREQGIASAGNVAADASDRDEAMARDASRAAPRPRAASSCQLGLRE